MKTLPFSKRHWHGPLPFLYGENHVIVGWRRKAFWRWNRQKTSFEYNRSAVCQRHRKIERRSFTISLNDIYSSWNGKWGTLSVFSSSCACGASVENCLLGSVPNPLKTERSVRAWTDGNGQYKSNSE